MHTHTHAHACTHTHTHLVSISVWTSINQTVLSCSESKNECWVVWDMNIIRSVISGFFVCLFVCFLLFRTMPMAYKISQARGPIGTQLPQLQQHQIWAVSETYTTAHGNTGSLTHWEGPRIKSASSWLLVGFVNHYAMMGTPRSLISSSIALFISYWMWGENLCCDNGHVFLAKI